ncbi:hypothetical protein D3C79_935260 [compost metagenome]
MRHALAYQLQVAEVAFDPVPDGHLELCGTGRQIGLDERRQLATSTLEQGHELVQRGAGVLCLVQQEAERAGDQQGQGTDHQGTQQRHRQPTCALPRNDRLQAWREHVDQLEHQQPGQQAG